MSLVGLIDYVVKRRARQRHLHPRLQTPERVLGQGPRHMSAGPASLPAPCIQLWSSGAKPMPLLKNTGVDSLSILQQIFLIKESNQDLLHCRQILYQLSYQGSPNPYIQDKVCSPTQTVSKMNSVENYS